LNRKPECQAAAMAEVQALGRWNCPEQRGQEMTTRLETWPLVLSKNLLLSNSTRANRNRAKQALAYALILLMLGAKSSYFPRQNDIERSTLNWLYILITL